MPDRYQNFNELSQNENAYVVEQNLVPNSTWLIAAPHGGNIESGTTEIALAISHACSSSYYSFIGRKSLMDGDLHLTSHHFDEPHLPPTGGFTSEIALRTRNTCRKW